jgi:Phage integrase family
VSVKKNPDPRYKSAYPVRRRDTCKPTPHQVNKRFGSQREADRFDARITEANSLARQLGRTICLHHVKTLDDIDEAIAAARTGLAGAGDDTTVTEFVYAWIVEREDLDDSSKTTYHDFRRNHIGLMPWEEQQVEAGERTWPASTPLGLMPIGQVTTGDVVAWKKSRMRPEFLTEKDIEQYGRQGTLNRGSAYWGEGHLGSCFGTAVDKKLIAANPVPPHKRGDEPAPDNAEFEVITNQMLLDWARAARKRVRLMILAQALLGPRIRELCDLRAGDVVLGQWPTVKIDSQLAYRSQADGGWQQKRRKNGRWRESYKVPLSHVAVVVLRAAMDFRAAELGRELRPDDLIFTTSRGNPWTHSQQWLAYHEAAVRGGLPEGDYAARGELPASHDLRHYFVSVLIHRRVELWKVAKWTGDSEKVISTTYRHLLREAEEEGRAAMDRHWGVEPGDEADGVSTPPTIVTLGDIRKVLEADDPPPREHPAAKAGRERRDAARKLLANLGIDVQRDDTRPAGGAPVPGVKAAILALHEAGHNKSVIADVCGVDHHTVRWHLTQDGIPNGPLPGDAADRQRGEARRLLAARGIDPAADLAAAVAVLREAGFAVKLIADVAGVPKGRVERRLPRPDGGG